MIRDTKKIIIEEPLNPEEEEKRYKQILAKVRQDTHEAHLFFRDQKLNKKSKVFLLQLWELLDKVLTARAEKGL